LVPAGCVHVLAFPNDEPESTVGKLVEEILGEGQQVSKTAMDTGLGWWPSSAQKTLIPLPYKHLNVIENSCTFD
jgi:hypothetical protein